MSESEDNPVQTWSAPPPPARLLAQPASQECVYTDVCHACMALSHSQGAFSAWRMPDHARKGTVRAEQEDVKGIMHAWVTQVPWLSNASSVYISDSCRSRASSHTEASPVPHIEYDSKTMSLMSRACARQLGC